MRDLVRAREAAQEAQKRARQQLQSFLLRHGRVYSGRSSWSLAHPRWRSALKFEHPAHSIVLKEYCQAIEDAEVRLKRLTDLSSETVKSWTMAPVVEAYQALRGVSLIAAVVFVAEIGDIRRFENPRQLMAFLGLVPSESSTGEHVKRGGITKAGNSRARRMLIEGAWAYRFPARVSRTKQAQLEGLPRTVREIAWKGQLRLCSRSRNMIRAGKHKAIAITAIAREMAAFLWAIGQEVQPAHHA
jgi:transposase